MKNKVAAFLAIILIVALSMGAWAVQDTKSAELWYKDIKITLNGKAITPTDANGNAIEPFIIDGTTYLPVRAVANAVGLDVVWDADTSTVVLTDPGSAAQQSGTVIMNKNGIKITFMGFAAKTNGLSGFDIKLKIENSTAKNYTVQVRNLSLNGIMSSGSIFSSTVAAGKTANDAIGVYNLEEDGITTPITTAEFYFHIFNDDDWDDSFESGVITVS